MNPAASRQRRSAPQFDSELGISLSPTHCVTCGRFLGLQAIDVGAVKLFCPNCKQWTTVIGQHGLYLTEAENEAKMGNGRA